MNILRIITQVILCVWLMPFIPLAVEFSGSQVSLLFDPNRPSGIGTILITVLMAFSPISIGALLISVFVPLKFLRKKKWLLWPTVSLLVCGSGVALIFLGAGAAAFNGALDWTNVYWVIWMFGGPLSVAIWNLVRLFMVTNQALLPTTKSVAAPAGQEPRQP